jgi:hypothetical protein
MRCLEAGDDGLFREQNKMLKSVSGETSHSSGISRKLYVSPLAEATYVLQSALTQDQTYRLPRRDAVQSGRNYQRFGGRYCLHFQCRRVSQIGNWQKQAAAAFRARLTLRPLR